jgi:3-(methylthio)propanoyl-CoA dehydrogenase
MKKIVRLKENDFKERDEFDHAPLDYEDAMDSYEKVLEIVGEIAGETIHPNAEGVDHDGPVLLDNEVRYAAGTQEDHDVLVKAGLVGMSLPRNMAV